MYLLVTVMLSVLLLLHLLLLPIVLGVLLLLGAHPPVNRGGVQSYFRSMRTHGHTVVVAAAAAAVDMPWHRLRLRQLRSQPRLYRDQHTYKKKFVMIWRPDCVCVWSGVRSGCAWLCRIISRRVGSRTDGWGLCCRLHHCDLLYLSCDLLFLCCDLRCYLSWNLRWRAFSRLRSLNVFFIWGLLFVGLVR